ncbi:dihyrdofolate reductase [Bacillus phage Mater]|uniref:dihydrofolate reductase n=1 Tax=Bacillus phage Mater TaxID=1540090 RepID=A0A0A0RMZ5_9CAUD|nr:dihydrofolate reductase [Bacillus phage Mater]AIW03372.1 dihyrdofolate reductase [Bacillus phage Mater]
MHVSLIAAIDKRRGIGRDNQLLWHIKEDFDWFKNHTRNKTVVMGRKTYESIGKPLKGRLNVVLTRDTDYDPHPDVLVRNDLAQIFFEFRHETELMIIGGETIYTQCLPYANRLYLTEIDKEFNADAFFPEFSLDQWNRFFHAKGSDDVGFNYSFNVYKKKLNLEGMKNNVNYA